MDKDEIIQKLKKENQKLKKEINRLKKEVQNSNFIENDKRRREYLYYKRKESELLSQIKKLEDKWVCHECGRGVLEIYDYYIGPIKKYYRQCNFCGHRTKSQKYHDNVKGIKKIA